MTGDEDYIPPVARFLIHAVLVIFFALFAAFIWLGATGFFDAVPGHPQPCPAVWRADCEAARQP